MKKEDRLKIYRKYDGHCAYCGKSMIGWIASCINKARLGIGDFVEIVDKEEK